jgi:hypothetical protein
MSPTNKEVTGGDKVGSQDALSEVTLERETGISSHPISIPQDNCTYIITYCEKYVSHSAFVYLSPVLYLHICGPREITHTIMSRLGFQYTLSIPQGPNGGRKDKTRDRTGEGKGLRTLLFISPTLRQIRNKIARDHLYKE